MLSEPNDIVALPKPKNPNSRWMTLDEHGNLISEARTPDEAIKLAKLKTENFTVLFIPKEGTTYIF
ncbi:hypothetical protein [Parafilimonas terrae]|uniref:DUF5678 domain-containing protein n=1 Tax=Parafilimonas terrae TaxID=1465490 RepID=A0A1I5UD07_9BACT|nr:hypothetical protein [Parafilimonas terrae]SFP92506.1 hypothetical protein SAMN05444277_103181 [Parafilimonas terrae]